MSVTLQQPARLLALYRRLLGNGQNLWAGPNSQVARPVHGLGPSDSYNMRMDELTGCPDSILLAFAEIAALAHWKAREQRNRTLSVRELIIRGAAIERAVRQRPESSSQAAVEVLGGGTSSAAGLASLSAGSGYAQHHAQTQTLHHRLVASIYEEAAVLYLNTVLSGCNPGACFR